MATEYKLSLTAKEIDDRLVKMGNVNNLETESGEVVGAINELNEKTGNISLALETILAKANTIIGGNQ